MCSLGQGGIYTDSDGIQHPAVVAVLNMGENGEVGIWVFPSTARGIAAIYAPYSLGNVPVAETPTKGQFTPNGMTVG